MKRWANWLVGVMLLWTNPSTNVDGTPCRDLAAILIEAVRESDGAKVTGIQPLCELRDSGDVVCRSGPGLPDSTQMTLPERYGTDWWHFTVWAADSSGNVSQPSNVVRLDLGRAGTPTGIPDLSDADPTKDVEWYDFRGRRIQDPHVSGASGVYFRRTGDVVKKVLVLK